MLPFKRILCPTDFSEPSLKGIEAGNELAEHFSAELLLVSVVTPVYPMGAPGVPATYNIGKYYEEMNQFSSQSLDKIETENVKEGIKTQRFVLQGNAAEEIVKLAEQEKVDAIVIATHGWTGWRRFIHGSVTEHVVRMARCPVITVPEPKENEE